MMESPMWHVHLKWPPKDDHIHDIGIFAQTLALYRLWPTTGGKSKRTRLENFSLIIEPDCTQYSLFKNELHRQIYFSTKLYGLIATIKQT